MVRCCLGESLDEIAHCPAQSVDAKSSSFACNDIYPLSNITQHIIGSVEIIDDFGDCSPKNTSSGN